VNAKSAAIVLALAALIGAGYAQACRIPPRPADNSPRTELYRDADRALVVGTVVRGGLPAEARLRVDEVIYGRIWRRPLALGWAGDPQFSFRYQTTFPSGDGTVIVVSCGQYVPFQPEVRVGQRVIARLGVTLDGSQVTIRWQPLEIASRDPRIAAFLAIEDRSERRKAGRALSDFAMRGDVVTVTSEGR
jgi:hypothetical protein